jgi:prefoldin beta subunit
MKKDTEQKIEQLQRIEQSMQNILMQKQQFQSQMIEIESALNELKNSEENYKIIGNIMVKANKEELQKDLSQKRELFELRIKTIEKQEKETKEKASKIQTEVMQEIEGN